MRGVRTGGRGGNAVYRKRLFLIFDLEVVVEKKKTLHFSGKKKKGKLERVWEENQASEKKKGSLITSG